MSGCLQTRRHRNDGSQTINPSPIIPPMSPTTLLQPTAHRCIRIDYVWWLTSNLRAEMARQTPILGRQRCFEKIKRWMDNVMKPTRSQACRAILDMPQCQTNTPEALKVRSSFTQLIQTHDSSDAILHNDVHICYYDTLQSTLSFLHNTMLPLHKAFRSLTTISESLTSPFT